MGWMERKPKGNPWRFPYFDTHQTETIIKSAEPLQAMMKQGEPIPRLKSEVLHNSAQRGSTYSQHLGFSRVSLVFAGRGGDNPIPCRERSVPLASLPSVFVPWQQENLSRGCQDAEDLALLLENTARQYHEKLTGTIKNRCPFSQSAKLKGHKTTDASVMLTVHLGVSPNEEPHPAGWFPFGSRCPSQP